jgi:transposase
MAEARLKRINRSQSYWGQVDVENLIGPDHAARAIWELSGTLDVSGFLKDNKSVEGRAGAERTDPRLLISVWVYGLTLGIGSARELERRLEQEPGLRWLCGDEAINHHTLSDFRVEHGCAVEKIFSQVLAVLSESGLVRLEELTVDGTKIQAQASAASLRREPTLRERLEQAEAVVKELSQGDHGEQSARVAAARKRAAREQQQRLSQALEELQEIRQHKPPAEREQARVSLSEPEARVMKNGQGGFAPSYNVQSVVDGAHKIVLDVEVTQAASDQQQLPPALERVRAELPATEKATVIVDGGYLTEHSIAEVEKSGVELIGPVLEREESSERGKRQSLAQAGIAEEFGPQAFRILDQGASLQCPAGKLLPRISRAQNHDQYRAAAADCAACSHRPLCCPHSGRRSVKIKRAHPVVEAFHRRMRQEESSAIYRRRGEIAEFPHAWWKEKFRLRKFHVRGLAKVRVEMKWAALAYNLQQWIRLVWRPQLALRAA